MTSGKTRSGRVLAPAKLNLGLEIVGRRDDGFHDIATIFLAVSMCDVLEIRDAPDLLVEAPGLSIPPEKNLVWRAASAMRKHEDTSGAAISVFKTIPEASGMGGASSDAAATLLALRDFWGIDVNEMRLAEMALRLGSDVPFFLSGGCALGLGRGEQLAQLPVPTHVWFALVVPILTIPHKTASLYSALLPRDFSSGESVQTQAQRLLAHEDLDPTLMVNGFTRALHAAVPSLADLPGLMRAAGASHVAISGAGPTHFATFTDPAAARNAATQLRACLRNEARVFVVEPVQGRYD